MNADRPLPLPPHPVLAEERAWESAIASILGEGAELVSVSRYIGDSRVYRLGEQLAKVRSLSVELPPGVSRLDREAEILRHLGQAVDYVADGRWEAILLPRIDAVPLDSLLSTWSPLRRARVLARLMPKLRRLHGKGVAHRDLRPENVLVTSDGNPAIVDFDRATLAAGWATGLADWLGLAQAGLSPNPFWKLALLTMAPKSGSLARRARAVMSGTNGHQKHSTGEAAADPLAAAWSLARRSPANAPGQMVAYYAFTYKGRHFPGERPWYARWEPIRRAVDFRGKRLLEFGSNMGLLSSFAKIYGAAGALGVDHDPLIIESARLVAQGLGTGAAFEQVDLIGDPAWEERLGGADIAVAMSIVHWLPEPERLLRFLGRHAEVIYEGHDPVDVETARLRSVGFDEISVIAETDRDRFLLHGRQLGGLHAGR